MFSVASIPRASAVLILVACLSACSSDQGAMKPFPLEKKMTNTNQLLMQEIEALLVAADKAVEKEEWVLANTLLKKGLDTLGSLYVSPKIVDDSGMKLVLASAEEKKGSFQVAATIRRRVLAARLSLLREKTLDAAS